jgi:hypothetical protein
VRWPEARSLLKFGPGKAKKIASATLMNKLTGTLTKATSSATK